MHNMRVTEDLRELARYWWEAQRLAHGSRGERERWSVGEPAEVVAAWGAAREVVDRGGEAALNLIVALLDSAPGDSGRSTVGAGPLEEIVTEYGDVLSAQLDRLARTSVAFRQALSSVWLDAGALSPAASRQLARWIPGLGAPRISMTRA